MFLIDFIIILFLAFGFIIGFKHGFTREVVSLLGVILITILSFLLKNPISIFFYKNLPFLKFNYLIKSSCIFNILFYEIIAFLIVFFLLFILLKILIKVTNLFEKFLKATIILSIPSKLLGGFVGVIKHYIIVFLVLYVISLPIFSIDVGKTKIGNFMLKNSFGLSNVTGNTVKVFDEFSNLVDKYKKNNNNNNFDQDALDILIKYDAITKDNAQDLIDSGKLTNVKVN